MSLLFADSFYFLALVNPDDAAHEEAVQLSRQRWGRHVTTTWVLTEVGDALAAPAQRGVFLALLNRIRANPQVTVVPPSQDLFDRGLDLFAKRPDKEWSVTDCVSFVVMREHGIQEALTADHHFEQAGFTLLLKSPSP